MTTIGLLYDMHIQVHQRRQYDGIPRARRAIGKLNDVDVDWTVVGGDLRTLTSRDPDRADWGRWHDEPDNPYYRRDFAAAKELLEVDLDSPYYAIRGNHDRPLAAWREYFPAHDHPRYFTFEDDGARFIFLDSNPHEGYHHLTQTQNFVTAPQLSMLERLMDDDPEIPTFVFSHALLAKHTNLEPDWATGWPAAYYLTLNYLSVQHLLERGNTIFVNTGHYSRHERDVETVEGIDYVIGRHLGGSDPDYAGDVRWMTVDADAGRAAVHYCDLQTDEEGTLVEARW